MHVLAHRGSGTVAHPNSTEAFSKTFQNGYGCEVDLRLTNDDVFVVAHDETVQTGSSTTHRIREMNFDNLVELTDESEVDLPTLSDIFELYTSYVGPRTKIGLHLKDYDIAGVEQLLVDVLYNVNENYTKLDVFERVFVFDVLLENAERFASLEPELDVALSVAECEYFPDPAHPTVYCYPDVRESQAWNTVWVDDWRGGYYASELFDTFKSDGRKVYAVSPELHANTDPEHPSHDSPEDIWPVLTTEKIDGICTDYPGRLEEFLQSRM